MRYILNLLNLLRTKPKGDIKKILFLRLDNKIGDSVVDSFFIRGLRKLYPTAHITVMLCAPYDIMYQNNPDVVSIITIPQNGKWAAAFKKLLSLRAQKYDLLIDIPWGGTIKRALYLYLIGAGNVMSCAKGYNFVNYPFTVHPLRHISIVMADGLKQLGACEVDTSYSIYPPQQAICFADNFLQPFKGSKVLLVNLQGASPARTFTQSAAAALLSAIAQLPQIKIVLLCHTQQYSQTYGALVCKTADIMQAAAMVSRADYILSVDTGIVHIADAFNKQTIVMYADDAYSIPANRIVWRPKNCVAAIAAQGTVSQIDIATVTAAVKGLINE